MTVVLTTALMYATCREDKDAAADGSSCQCSQLLSKLSKQRRKSGSMLAQLEYTCTFKFSTRLVALKHTQSDSDSANFSADGSVFEGTQSLTMATVACTEQIKCRHLGQTSQLQCLENTGSHQEGHGNAANLTNHALIGSPHQARPIISNTNMLHAESFHSFYHCCFCSSIVLLMNFSNSGVFTLICRRMDG